MKQIFDWLREQMQERIKAYQTLDVTETAVDVAIKETERFIEYINEAEAKWEKDCCIWTNPSKEHRFIKNPHTGRIFSNEPSMQNVYCNTCGKPIKISEVE